MWFRKGGSHVKKSVYGLEDKAKVVHLMLKTFFFEKTLYRFNDYHVYYKSTCCNMQKYGEFLRTCKQLEFVSDFFVNMQYVQANNWQCVFFKLILVFINYQQRNIFHSGKKTKQGKQSKKKTTKK